MTNPIESCGESRATRESVLAAYRGWMVTPSQYRVLYDALVARGIRLINDPDQYRHGHHLPENYPVIEGRTPRSVWLTGDLGIDRIMEALTPFGDAPVIVKDFVKSRKHEWAEACFIPSAADRQAVERVVGRFLELQGEDLERGPGLPGVRRVRADRRPPEERDAADGGVPDLLAGWRPDLLGSLLGRGRRIGTCEPPIERFAGVAAAVRSRFFTMDLARRRDGELDDRRGRGRPGLRATEGVRRRSLL